MPRVSAAAQSVVGNGHGIETVRRPSPPSDLIPEEQKVWKEVVAGMPADWFPPETHGLLTQYCRLTIDARRHSILKHEYFRKKKEMSLTVYRRMIKEEVAITHEIHNLARSMRLSQGSTSRQEYVKKRPMTTPRPWDDDDEDEAAEDNETEN